MCVLTISPDTGGVLTVSKTEVLLRSEVSLNGLKGDARPPSRKTKLKQHRNTLNLQIYRWTRVVGPLVGY